MRILFLFLIAFPALSQPVLRSIVVGNLLNTNQYVEYGLFTNNIGVTTVRTYTHCCPLKEVTVRFSSTVGKQYVVRGSETLDRIRLSYRNGGLAEVNTVNLNTNSTEPGLVHVVTNHAAFWSLVSPILNGTGGDVTYRFNAIYPSGFFRVQEL